MKGNPIGSEWTNSKGVTLIELIVGLAVVALLSAVAVPAFTSALQSRRLAEATQKVVGDLRNLQSMAIARGGMFRLHSGTDPLVNRSGQYRLEQNPDGTGNTWNLINNWAALSSEFQGVGFAIRDSAGPPVVQNDIRFNSRGVVANLSNPTYPLNVVITGVSQNRTIQITRFGRLTVQ